MFNQVLRRAAASLSPFNRRLAFSKSFLSIFNPAPFYPPLYSQKLKSPKLDWFTAFLLSTTTSTKIQGLQASHPEKRLILPHYFFSLSLGAWESELIPFQILGFELNS